MEHLIPYLVIKFSPHNFLQSNVISKEKKIHFQHGFQQSVEFWKDFAVKVLPECFGWQLRLRKNGLINFLQV